MDERLGLARGEPLDAQREIRGDRLACPNCGGSIQLVVPERSLSVACSYCGSILDCEGPLAILSKQERRDSPQPFPLGASAEFEGVRYVVTGRLRRRAVYDEVTIEWDEWLLYEQTTFSSSGARGLAGGSIFTADGRLVVNVVQEGLIRVKR